MSELPKMLTSLSLSGVPLVTLCVARYKPVSSEPLSPFHHLPLGLVFRTVTLIPPAIRNKKNNNNLA